MDAGASPGFVVAARANPTVYATTELIKVASNPGRVFICTVAGTSAGSEPAGYATAVDGDLITDNTATFQAMWRAKAAVTVTPQEKGYLHARIMSAKSNFIIYVDPLLTVS